ncbi:MAG: cache domain-containing protein [Bdellovibrionales bacterium]
MRYIIQADGGNMKIWTKLSLAAAALFLTIGLVSPSLAAERGSKEEAKALVERAAAYLKENGKAKAIPEFNKPNGMFTDRDLYVFAMGMDGIRLAHGKNKKLVGLSIEDFKDVDGKPYGKEIMEIGRGVGSGWVDYKFTDPLTKKIAEKTSYVQREGDVVIAAGAYK